MWAKGGGLYENAVAQPGAVAASCGVTSTPEAKLLAQQTENQTVEFTAEKRAYNGLYVITYDPSVVQIVGVDSTADVLSWSDQNGTVTFGFAQNPASVTAEVNETVQFTVETIGDSIG